MTKDDCTKDRSREVGYYRAYNGCSRKAFLKEEQLRRCGDGYLLCEEEHVSVEGAAGTPAPRHK